jgi:large subunit ribosomal protein L10e
MASKKLRKGQCYRMHERAYTRKSKYKKRNYIKAVPQHKIVKFNMGNSKKEFKYRIDLISKGALQIRHNSIEATRQAINRKLVKLIGNQDFYLMVRVYPHHAQRENKQMGGQHADRIQSGMKHPFGRIMNVAALVKEGKELFTAYTDEKGLEAVRETFKAVSSKLPCKIGVDVFEINKN